MNHPANSSTITTENELDASSRSLWLKALTAIERNNFEFAISLIRRVLETNPGFLQGRKELRRAEIRFTGKKKETKIFGITIKGGGGGSMKLSSSSRKPPLEAIIEAEAALQSDPFNKAANQALFEAALRSNLPETAAFALETIKEGHPNDTRNLHQLAEHYLTMDEPDKASSTYQLILRVDSTDMDAIQGEKNSSARNAMKQGNWESGDMRSSLKNKDETESLEAGARTGMTKDQMLARLEELWPVYHQNNNDINVVKKIADIYEQLEDWSSAHQWYGWALQLNPADVSMEARAASMGEKAEVAEFDRLESQISEATDPSEAERLRADLEGKRQERSDRLLNESQARVERNPTDKQLRFDLAMRLMDANRHSDAIPHLQQAKASPHLRNRSLLALGRCFKEKNMADMAIAQYEEANADLKIMDATKKEVLYELGRIYEAAGNKDKYLECMKEIYNTEYGYRDVAKRVEASYS